MKEKGQEADYPIETIMGADYTDDIALPVNKPA